MDMVQAVLSMDYKAFQAKANTFDIMDDVGMAMYDIWAGIAELIADRAAAADDEDNERDAEYWENYAEYQRELMADLWWGRI